MAVGWPQTDTRAFSEEHSRGGCGQPAVLGWLRVGEERACCLHAGAAISLSLVKPTSPPHTPPQGTRQLRNRLGCICSLKNHEISIWRKEFSSSPFPTRSNFFFPPSPHLAPVAACNKVQKLPKAAALSCSEQEIQVPIWHCRPVVPAMAQTCKKPTAPAPQVWHSVAGREAPRRNNEQKRKPRAPASYQPWPQPTPCFATAQQSARTGVQVEKLPKLCGFTR